MKKTWEAPRIEVQEFEANEYVAACWGVACELKGWHEINGSRQEHRPDACGNPDNQYVVSNAAGIPAAMKELHHTVVGDMTFELNCTRYTDESYTVTKDYSDVAPDTTMYWTTRYLGVTYYHKGKVNLTDMKHPNRS